MKREDINFILQMADKEKLKSLYKKIKDKVGVKILTKPTAQTLLLPVHDPINGGEFYAGEVLTTSAIVKCGSDKGWAMVMDDESKICIYIAAIDAVFESKMFEKEIQNLCDQTLLKQQHIQNEINRKVNSTNVKFDLMVQK
ncbi:phosphonate C-P lyase system protein PhnG [Campylobacter suis]|uniref:Phosphonate C-P lyase system protein PhnG n=1 Tax=Campylobacter suis TaxID=2790657 RepID=A0ABM8Q8X0_9BACT|nr:phosphonate C-P lyase system protein PhnG [Campylobacter suis]CAD7289329.1 hypothetical protein LMG8286_01759 [Campylobacter suis]